MFPRCILFPIFMLFLASGQSFAQDTLYFRPKEKIAGKVTDIGPDQVAFKKTGMEDGPIFRRLLGDLDSIRFSGGQVERFAHLRMNRTAGRSYGNKYPTNPSFDQGFEDAATYYKGYKGIAVGSYVAGLVTLYGIPIPLIGSTTRPKNLEKYVPDLQKFKNDPDYARGFANNARSIKSKKAWSNYGYGVATTSAVYVVLILAVLSSFN
jgi:hypothetical protein